jgi:hypothetical protein
LLTLALSVEKISLVYALAGRTYRAGKSMHLQTIISILHAERGEVDKAILSVERSLNTQTAERAAQSVTEIGRSRNHIRIIAELQSLWSASEVTWEREQIKLAVVALLRLDRVGAETRQTGVAEQGRAYGAS